MARKTHDWVCEACNARITVFGKANSITHALCPKREARKNLPRYVPVDGDTRATHEDTEYVVVK